MDDATRDPIIGQALDRYVPRDGWVGDWRTVIARSTRRPRRRWVMGATVVAVAGAVFAVVAGSILRSSSTAEHATPPSGDPTESLVAVVHDDGRISWPPYVTRRIADLTRDLELCVRGAGADFDGGMYGEGLFSDLDGDEESVPESCRGEQAAMTDFGGSEIYRRAVRSRTRALGALHQCLIREMGSAPDPNADETIDAPPGVLRVCVADARITAEEEPATTTDTQATTTRPGTVEVTIEGRRFVIPGGLTEGMDFRSGRILGRIRGEQFVLATQRATGDACYVSFSGSGVGTVGCDPREHLVAKGGWLISRRGAQGAREGLVIVPTKDGDLRFTVTPFNQVRPGTTFAVPGPDGVPREYTVP